MQKRVKLCVCEKEREREREREREEELRSIKYKINEAVGPGYS